MTSPASLDDVIVVSTDQVSADLSGETIILGMREGAYFGVSSAGSRIWSLLQQPRRLGDVVSILTSEYEVDARQCATDVLAFVDDLLSRGLVSRDGPSAG
ncbi:MAG: PqqD family protein [Gemmatimonas sp.]|nr:PqqD family protein [Gemmatimonas sp.]